MSLPGAAASRAVEPNRARRVTSNCCARYALCVFNRFNTSRFFHAGLQLDLSDYTISPHSWHPRYPVRTVANLRYGENNRMIGHLASETWCRQPVAHLSHRLTTQIRIWPQCTMLRIDNQ